MNSTGPIPEPEPEPESGFTQPQSQQRSESEDLQNDDGAPSKPISQAVFLFQGGFDLKCKICTKQFKNKGGLASHELHCKRKSLTGETPTRTRAVSFTSLSSPTVPPNGGTVPNPNVKIVGTQFGIGPNREIRLVQTGTKISDVLPTNGPEVNETTKRSDSLHENLDTKQSEVNETTKRAVSLHENLDTKRKDELLVMHTLSKNQLKGYLKSFPELSKDTVMRIMGFPLKDGEALSEDLTKIDISNVNHVLLERIVGKVRILARNRAQIMRRIVSALSHELNDSCPRYYRIHPNLQLPDDPKNNAIMERINQKALDLELEILQVVIEQNLEQLEHNTRSFNDLIRDPELMIDTVVRRNVILTFLETSTRSYMRFGPLGEDDRTRVSGLKRFLADQEKKNRTSKKVTTLESFLKRCKTFGMEEDATVPRKKVEVAELVEDTKIMRTDKATGTETTPHTTTTKKYSEVVDRIPRIVQRTRGPVSNKTYHNDYPKMGKRYEGPKEFNSAREHVFFGYMSAHKVQKHWAALKMLEESSNSSFQVKRGLIGKPPLSLFRISNRSKDNLLLSLSEERVCNIGPIFIPLTKELNAHEIDLLRNKFSNIEQASFPTRCLIVRNFGGLRLILPLLMGWRYLNRRFPNF